MDKGVTSGGDYFRRVQIPLTIAFLLIPTDNPQAAKETQFSKPMSLYETPAVTGIYMPPLHGSWLAVSEIRVVIL